MTHFGMPLTSIEALAAFLEAGWTCFRHRGTWWITTRVGQHRAMIRVPDWQVAHLKRQHRATQSGVVLAPTFSFSHRRIA